MKKKRRNINKNIGIFFDISQQFPPVLNLTINAEDKNWKIEEKKRDKWKRKRENLSYFMCLFVVAC